MASGNQHMPTTYVACLCLKDRSSASDGSDLPGSVALPAKAYTLVRSED